MGAVQSIERPALLRDLLETGELPHDFRKLKSNKEPCTVDLDDGEKQLNRECCL